MSTAVAPPTNQGHATVVVDSPAGPLSLSSASGALTGVHFGAKGHGRSENLAGMNHEDRRVLHATSDWLTAYFGASGAIDLPSTPPFRLHGTDFQVSVWQALQDIGWGQTVSYAHVARAVGRPSAVRAVAGAIGRNPVSIIVPCHRVIGTDGSLTGYGGGLDTKRLLLANEGWAARS